MTRRDFLLRDLDWGKDWRRPDGVAPKKAPMPEKKADQSPPEQPKAHLWDPAVTSQFLKCLSWIGVAIGVAIVLNMWAVKLGRGSYAHICAVMHGIVLIGLPAFVLSVVLMCVGRERHKRVFLAGYALNLAGLVTFLMLASACVGLFVAKVDVRDARNYCEGLVPRLEKYKQDTGRYPDDIKAVDSGECAPRLLQGTQFYIAQADGYILEFKHPAKRSEILEYASWKGTWEKRK